MAFTAANLCQQYQAALALAAKSKPESEISQVFCTNDKYEVKLDIQNFHPEDISVKAVDRFIIVEGSHEQKGEQLGIISHQFTRRYVLPDGVLPENVSCSLGSDGILKLSAPRNIQSIPKIEVVIPVQKNSTEATVLDVTSPKKENAGKSGFKSES